MADGFDLRRDIIGQRRRAGNCIGSGVFSDLQDLRIVGRHIDRINLLGGQTGFDRPDNQRFAEDRLDVLLRQAFRAATGRDDSNGLHRTSPVPG